MGRDVRRSAVLAIRDDEMSEWTPYMIERLRTLAAQGLYASDIARQMGLTKNAVIGKAWRKGIKLTPVTARPGTGNTKCTNCGMIGTVPRNMRRRCARRPVVRYGIELGGYCSFETIKTGE